MQQLKVKQNRQTEQQVLSILAIRFGLNPYLAIPIVKRWLARNTTKSWQELLIMLQTGKITLKEGKLQEVSQKKILQLIACLQSETAGIQLKKRWYNFKLYQKTFKSSQLIEWLITTAKMTKIEAINFEKVLIDCGIISPLDNNYSFQETDSYYQFYSEPSQIENLLEFDTTVVHWVVI